MESYSDSYDDESLPESKKEESRHRQFVVVEQMPIPLLAWLKGRRELSQGEIVKLKEEFMEMGVHAIVLPPGTYLG